jgi:hypothetical protein
MRKRKVRNIKLKPEMTREEIGRKIEQRAQAQAVLQGDPDAAEETLSMSEEEFLEDVGAEDVKIKNPPRARDLRRRITEINMRQLKKKKAALEQENIALAKRVNRIRRVIEC